MLVEKILRQKKEVVFNTPYSLYINLLIDIKRQHYQHKRHIPLLERYDGSMTVMTFALVLSFIFSLLDIYPTLCIRPVINYLTLITMCACPTSLGRYSTTLDVSACVYPTPRQGGGRRGDPHPCHHHKKIIQQNYFLAIYSSILHMFRRPPAVIGTPPPWGFIYTIIQYYYIINTRYL